MCPPPGTTAAKQSGKQNRRAPCRALGSPPFPSAARVQSRGCKGRSPLHEKTLVSPFPPGRGMGGWGQESKRKARLAGACPPAPPFRHHSGKKPLIHRRKQEAGSRKQEAKSPEPGTCADSGQQKMSLGKFWGYGGLFQDSPGVSPITGSVQTATLPDRRWRRGNRCGRGRYRLRRGTLRCRWRRSRRRCRGTARRAR